MRSTLFLAVAAFAVLFSFSVQAQSLNGLTNDEIAKYNSLKSNPAEAKSYRDTRCFLLVSRAVMSKTLSANKLPVQPEDYNSDYVTDAEQKIVDDAVIKFATSMLSTNSPNPQPIDLCAP